MLKATLILLIFSVAVNSVHLLPTKEFVEPNTPENSEKRNLIRKENTRYSIWFLFILNICSRTLKASWT